MPPYLRIEAKKLMKKKRRPVRTNTISNLFSLTYMYTDSHDATLQKRHCRRIKFHIRYNFVQFFIVHLFLIYYFCTHKRTKRKNKSKT